MNNIIELNFEAENVNDEGWEQVISTLKQNLSGFSVSYADGDNMTFSFHTHKYEVWDIVSGDTVNEECMLSTDDLEEAKKEAHTITNYNYLEKSKYDKFSVEIRTDFDDSTGSYNTIDF